METADLLLQAICGVDSSLYSFRYAASFVALHMGCSGAFFCLFCGIFLERCGLCLISRLPSAFLRLQLLLLTIVTKLSPMLRHLVISLFARLPGVAIALETMLLGVHDSSAAEWQPAETANGQVVVRQGLAIASVGGSAAEIGTAEGELFKARIKPLLELMAIQPRLVMARNSASFKRSCAAISPDDRIRLSTIASAAGVPAQTLINANALVDAQCSAVVALARADRPLRVARNMDFFPAAVLGPGTCLEVVRQSGKRAYAAIGWPGSVAVISGMNDAGLVACILLNHDGDDLPGGEPLGLRLMHILQLDDSVTTATERFAATPVASSHYVLLADATTATIVWQGRDGLHRDDPQDGWLTATNGPRKDAQPQDDRGSCLRGHCTSTAVPDAAWMRQILTASYLPGINAQAMVFEPATRTVELALGSGKTPAATAIWWRVPLTPLFAGTPVTEAAVEQLPASVPLKHYTQ